MSDRRRTTKIKTDFERLNKFNPTNPVGLKGDYCSKSISNTRMLTRIIACLYENKYLIKQDFKEIYGLSQPSLNDALNWLVNNKIVIYGNDTRQWRGSATLKYYLNPKWVELRNE